MKAVVNWRGPAMHFEGESASGNTVMMDCTGEGAAGASPMELLLLSVGGCSAVDVVSILQKSRQDVTDCRVEIDGERRDEIPRVYTHIKLHYRVFGNQLSEKHVARAVQLSMDKYCSVSKMLGQACTIDHSYSLEPAEATV